MRDELRPYIGRRVGGDPTDELEHFYLCKACQQPVDKRDLAAVFHHEEPGHEPLPAEDAERLIRISEQLRAAWGNSVHLPVGSPAKARRRRHGRQ